MAQNGESIDQKKAESEVGLNAELIESASAAGRLIAVERIQTGPDSFAEPGEPVDALSDKNRAQLLDLGHIRAAD